VKTIRIGCGAGYPGDRIDPPSSSALLDLEIPDAD